MLHLVSRADLRGRMRSLKTTAFLAIDGVKAAKFQTRLVGMSIYEHICSYPQVDFESWLLPTH